MRTFLAAGRVRPIMVAVSYRAKWRIQQDLEKPFRDPEDGVTPNGEPLSGVTRHSKITTGSG
jgi:hypothetical protein